MPNIKSWYLTLSFLFFLPTERNKKSVTSATLRTHLFVGLNFISLVGSLYYKQTLAFYMKYDKPGFLSEFHVQSSSKKLSSSSSPSISLPVVASLAI